MQHAVLKKNDLKMKIQALLFIAALLLFFAFVKDTKAACETFNLACFDFSKEHHPSFELDWFFTVSYCLSSVGQASR